MVKAHLSEVETLGFHTVGATKLPERHIRVFDRDLILSLSYSG
jgi:hypothetical protein